ncbi:NAD(P)H-binding protein [Kibdelosporangium philippinense]|uniref:NAD(P)H-binding protein n=1 Tax=Kibdelosporangium philippinense TaxID=211113 RepID=A0ABS8Z512_9PSEU|nr:NmrA family NAD(P)-binding protein [Kibdelosporangium philippinense]MCE7003001.1 NAD(P)H-binding protein [Kibdelosporangium philippinense]
MTSLKIAVYGATGAQGSAVVQNLLDVGHVVRAVARKPGTIAGVESVAADLADVDALVEGYTGVDGVVLQLPMVFDETAFIQARTVLAALGKAKVPRVVFNQGGALPDEPVGMPYVDARVLMSAGLPDVVETVAITGPVLTYMENLAAPWSTPLIDAGEVVYPLPGELPVPWVAASDVAAVIVDLLVQDAPPSVRVVAGPEDLTGDQVAAVLGSSVRWRTITPAEYGELLRPIAGSEAAEGIAALYANPVAPPDQAIVLRGTTTLKQWADRQIWR